MHRSRVVAALIDVPAEVFEAEIDFWSQTTGRSAGFDPDDPDYADLGEVSPGLAMMVQRVGSPARIHLDIETDDIDAEVQRLERAGATRVARIQSWWVMKDPAGLLFCVVKVQLPESFAQHAQTWP